MQKRTTRGRPKGRLNGTRTSRPKRSPRAKKGKLKLYENDLTKTKGNAGQAAVNVLAYGTTAAIGGAVGAAIGKGSPVLGIVIMGLGAYTGQPLLLSSGAGITVGHGLNNLRGEAPPATVEGLNGTQQALISAKARLVNYAAAMRHKLFLSPAGETTQGLVEEAQTINGELGEVYPGADLSLLDTYDLDQVNYALDAQAAQLAQQAGMAGTDTDDLGEVDADMVWDPDLMGLDEKAPEYDLGALDAAVVDEWLTTEDY